MKKVEQITQGNEVLMDFDSHLQVKEIKNFLSEYVDIGNDKNPFEAKYKGNDLIICAKALTYLGHPHPVFKKRIQIPGSWRASMRSYKCLLLGIYSYGNIKIIVSFGTEKYKSNKLNNSSAHVSTIDLQKGVEFGIFSKEDFHGNKITVIRADKFLDYLNSFVVNIPLGFPPEIDIVESFSLELKKEWKGKECYQEMIQANYHNKYQGEWPGFYLEYLFENFLDKKPKRKEVCVFVKNKKHGELDFDLNFNNQYLGDLKMHSNTSSTIIGNDKEDFMSCIKKDKKFWYVVLSHDTKKDKDYGYEVTKFWNDALTKSGRPKAELSYAGRMKYSVDLTDIMILEINKNNIAYVSDFAQPVNSNGKPREMKIQIKKNNIDNFLIYKKEF